MLTTKTSIAVRRSTQLHGMNKLLNWDNKLFIKEKVFTFSFMPLNFGAVMKRLNERVVNVSDEIPQWLCLSDHTSKWSMIPRR